MENYGKFSKRSVTITDFVLYFLISVFIYKFVDYFDRSFVCSFVCSFVRSIVLSFFILSSFRSFVFRSKINAT